MKGVYILANYPNIQTFVKEFNFLVNSKIDFIEVGIPFNDPVADGSVIAKASDEVAEKGYNLQDIIDFVKINKGDKKIYFMTYSNIIYHFGIKKFSDMVADTLNGIIIADLPNRGHNFFYKNGLEIPIISFVTPESRTEDISKLKNAKGDFIYFIGIRGITGGKIDFNDKDIINKYRYIKEVTNKKVILGFGVKTKDDTNKILSYADGFVIGTEIVRRQRDYDELVNYINEIFD